MCTSVVARLLFIFFFKQKTAYELRISDWRSDVCSSDLQVDDYRCECGGELVRHGVDAVAAVERVRSGAAGKPVIARTAVEMVDTRAAFEAVVAVAAFQAVVAVTALEVISAGVAEETVVTGAAHDGLDVHDQIGRAHV